MITLADAGLLFGAGVLAGVVGTAGGITSLISYPALLAVGIGTLPASVTNIVALTACWPGSTLSSRAELEKRGTWLRHWSVLAAGGALVGSFLLLSTSSRAFGSIVPYLLVFAAFSLIAQPRLAALKKRHGDRNGRGVLGSGLFLASAYNGYFGAGSGVILLTLLLLTVDGQIARANALKNMLVGVATVVSALVLVAFGHVDWAAAAPLAAGSFLGSTVGPLVARRIPSEVLRWLVALTGLGLAVRLWVSPL